MATEYPSPVISKFQCSSNFFTKELRELMPSDPPWGRGRVVGMKEIRRGKMFSGEKDK